LGFAWAHNNEVNAIENTALMGFSAEINKLHMGNQSKKMV
jgi:hypothetical protein